MSESRAKQGPRSTNERLRRLLVMLPWLMERGEVSVEEVARRFQVGEAQLIADLELIALCGLPPYQDELIDVYIDEGVVHVGVPRLFTKPLRLTAPEAFAVLTAARSAMQLPGADPEGPLARALTKLAAALGDGGVVVDLQPSRWSAELADAVSTSERVRIVYWTVSGDERIERVITPRAVFHDRGWWYVVGDDHHRRSERTFRIDRIESMERTGEHDEHRHVELADHVRWFDDDPAAQQAVLLVEADARWLLDSVPVSATTELPDGAVEVRLPVVNERWLERLLLRAGGHVTVAEPERWAHLGSRAARAVLARYG